MNYDVIIPEICLGPTGRIRFHFNQHKEDYPNILNYINTRYIDSKSIKESLSRMKYGVEDRPVCAWCGKEVDFRGIKDGKPVWASYCSISCATYGTEEDRKKTCIGKYGVDNPRKAEEVKQKIKTTCKEKYGYGCVLADREKMKKGMLDKYGVEHNMKSPVLKSRHQDAIEKKYGARVLSKSSIIKDRMMKTNLEKYGSPYTFTAKSISEKIKKNNLTKYGVEYPLMNSRIYRETQNGCHSKIEDNLYLYIKEKFPDVKRQYKCDRYPFYCDFYIPSLDLFLELQGTWVHGNHAYNSDSIEDQDILEKWKIKNTKYYNNAINIWSVSDVKKRKTAKENNLNFKEVWSLDEGKTYVDSL